MSNVDKRFWVRCPKCGERFGIAPKWVLKYIERVTRETGTRIETLAELLESAQATVEGETSCRECGRPV